MQNGRLIAKTRLFLSRIFLLEKFHSSVLNDEYLRCWIEQGGKITGIHQPGSIRVDSTLRLLPTEEFRSIRYHEGVAVGRGWVILEDTGNSAPTRRAKRKRWRWLPRKCFVPILIVIPSVKLHLAFNATEDSDSTSRKQRFCDHNSAYPSRLWFVSRILFVPSLTLVTN